MNEKDKVQMDKLEEYVRDYMLFIDTCSLMFDKGIDLFWSHIIPLLKRYNKKIYMPYKCWLELKKHAASNEPDKVYSAKKAMQDVSEYQKQGYISLKTDKWEGAGTFADNVFITVFNMYRTKYNLLLITQDNNLSKDIIALNNQKAVDSVGKRILAKRINKYGFLNHYDWEETGARPEDNSMSSSRQSSSYSASAVSSKEIFKICTTVSKVPVDPIRLSYVPHENDVVLARNGEIRLGDVIASGGEGTVYETNTPYVAKIYHDGKLTQRKYEKLKRIIEKQLKCDGICFPVSGLYNKNKEFVGYLMPKAKGKELQRSIFIKPLFLQQFPNWKKKELVQLCITILKKMQYLHERNIIMGDINAGNILVVSPTEVYFVDTDSYQIEDLPCPVGIVTFTPPELQGKQYKSFLRTMGNEYFAVATLMFMLMLPGKAPYAQQGGEDPATNIKNMDFSYPCGDKSNQKTPDGLWGYIWSHLSFKLKEAFYETFHKSGKYSTENTRLPVAEWIKLFNQYYYELTEGNMLKNDDMSGELFPTRLKKNPNAKYIICRLCKKEVDEGFSRNGICKTCLHLPAGKCKRCGKELDFTNFDKYIKNRSVPELCDSCMEANYGYCKDCGKRFLKTELKNGLCSYCQRNQVYTKITCAACGKPFEITYGEKEFFDKNGYELSKRCQTCRDNGVIARPKQQQSRSSYVAPTPKRVTQEPQKKVTPQKKVVTPPKVVKTSNSKPKLSWEEKLGKKRKQAIAKVQRICEDNIRDIEGFHPILKNRIRQYFQSLIRSISHCTDFDDIDDYIDEAEDFDIDYFD